jgi:hypothetical protein
MKRDKSGGRTGIRTPFATIGDDYFKTLLQRSPEPGPASARKEDNYFMSLLARYRQDDGPKTASRCSSSSTVPPLDLKCGTHDQKRRSGLLNIFSLLLETEEGAKVKAAIKIQALARGIRERRQVKVQPAMKDASRKMPRATSKWASQSHPNESQSKQSASGGLKRKLFTAVALLVLSMFACIYAVHEPNSNLAGQIKLGENSLLDVLRKVGKEIHMEIPDGLKTAAAASGKSSDKKTVIESQQGAVQAVGSIIGYAVKAAVTSGIGYGCYWLFTQNE